MQNNVTDLSQKLQRSLDNNYNVVDMPAVVEVISALEKTAVTKELLETTRLGKYINELRRRTDNESLAKRAKELLKRWRDLILPDANGGAPLRDKKRSARTPPDARGPKRTVVNGTRELDLSDNSNCSVKDLKKTDVIFINSDSNSSLPDAAEPPDGADAVPKKRGRKKGSKNHKNLVIAAEESFSNKMAVSRNSKVKTTQELLADLQSRGAPPRSQDIERRAAQLTESLSIIDQKLNPQKINKRNSRVAEATTTNCRASPSSVGFQVVTIQSDDEIVDVVGNDPPPVSASLPLCLTIEGLLAQLPPVDRSALVEPDEPTCLCEPPGATPVDSDSDEFARTISCGAQAYLQAKYLPDAATEERVSRLQSASLPNVNGNFGVRGAEPNTDSDLVPRLGAVPPAPHENFQKYSISIDASTDGGSDGCDRTAGAVGPAETEFREWHETVDVASYDGDVLRILPYVIID